MGGYFTFALMGEGTLLKTLIDILGGPSLNTTASKENVLDIERNIRVIKERMGYLTSFLPYKPLTRSMVIVMVKFVILCLNAFPTKGGSGAVSPRVITKKNNVLHS